MRDEKALLQWPVLSKNRRSVITVIANITTPSFHQTCAAFRAGLVNSNVLLFLGLGAWSDSVLAFIVGFLIPVLNEILFRRNHE